MKIVRVKYENVISLVTGVLVVLVITIVGSFLLSGLEFPYKVYSIDSGSMSPAIPVGSLVLTKKSERYEVGDAVSFFNDGNEKEITTHRINSITGEGYETKGDANNAPDLSVVPFQNVVGKVIFSIPYLGYPIAYSRTVNGFLVLVVLPAILIILSEVVNIIRELLRVFSFRSFNSLEMMRISRGN